MQVIGGPLLRLTTLGAIDVRDRLGHPVREVLAQPKRVALLAYLTLESRRGPVPRDRLVALFWPESDAAHARNALSQALHHLRAALGADAIENHGANAIAVRADRLWCDAVVFGESLERGEVDLALDLYRGEFCPALFADGTPELEQWLDRERQRLRNAARSAARELAERLAARGEREAAARAARRALALQPDDEADVRALLALLERVGDGAGALLAYHEYARRMTADLETEPAPETQQLVETIRQRREQAAAGAAPYPVPEYEFATVTRRVSPPGLQPPSRRRRALIVASLVVGFLAVSGTIALAWRARHAPTLAVRTIAVFPFSARGGTQPSYLGEGMVDLLSSKLDGVAGFRAIDPRSVVAAVENQGNRALAAADYATIARRLGADWFVTGDAVQVAGRLQISGQLHDGSGRPQALTAVTVSGDTAALFSLVDDLTGRVLAGLVSGRDTALTRLAAVTTHSLPALKSFLEGERAFRDGHDQVAGEAFVDAVTEDTTFALAYYRLASIGGWSMTARAAMLPLSAIEHAQRHAEQLSPLYRSLVSGMEAYYHNDANTAEATYREITASHPERVEAWFMLGETLSHMNHIRGRSGREGIPAFQRVLILDPDNPHALIHLARFAAAAGDTATLNSLVHRFLTRYPDVDRSLELRALRAFTRHDPVETAAVVADARKSPFLVTYFVFMAAAAFAQNFDAADQIAAIYNDPNRQSIEQVRQSALMLPEVPLAEGRVRAGRADSPGLAGVEEDWITEVRALFVATPDLPVSRALISALRDSIVGWRPHQVEPLSFMHHHQWQQPQFRAFLLALLDSRLGERASAERYRDSLHHLIGAPNDSGVAEDLEHLTAAGIARMDGRYAEALRELERFHFDPIYVVARMWGFSAYTRYLRADLLAHLGRDAEAQQWLESFPEVNDVMYLPLVDLRLARLLARHGKPAEARAHYTRFISSWKRCDAELQPLVTQAQTELAALPSS